MINYMEPTTYMRVSAALLDQADSDAPTDRVFTNGLGDYEWGRENTGTYTMTFTTPIFRNLPTKNWMSFTNSQNIPDMSIVVEYISTTVLRITTYNATPAAADALLSNSAIEIRVYNENL